MREKQTDIIGIVGTIALLLSAFIIIEAHAEADRRLQNKPIEDEYLAELASHQINQIKETQSQPDVRSLSVGKTVERQLKGGEIHIYTVDLKKGDVLRIDIEEKGIDVRVGLMKGYSQVVAKADFGFGYDRERLTRMIDQAGSYAVIVGTPHSPLMGNYQLMAIIKETATTIDYEEIKAEQLLAEGLASRGEGTAEGLQAAIAKWIEALPLWKKLGESYWEGYTSTYLGIVYSDLGEKQKALEFFNQALLLRRSVGDKRGEAATLSGIGGIHSDLGDKQKALKLYNQVLHLFRLINDKGSEATTLNNIGKIYSDLGDKQKALEFYNQALPLIRLVDDKSGEAYTLNNLGAVYDDLGEKRKALEFYNQALSLRRLVGDKGGEAYTLTNIGKVYSDLGESQRALEYLNQALSLFRAVSGKGGEATTLTNIGGVYSDLGEKQKALEFFNQALPLFRSVGDRRGEAYTITDIGQVYSALGEKQKALEFFNQALLLRRSVGDKSGEAGTLNNIGGVYSSLGELRKASGFYSQALLLFRLTNDKNGEAGTLNNIGGIYSSLGEKQRALEFFNQALLLLREVGDKRGEATTLNNIAGVYDELSNKQKALEFFNRSLLLFRLIGDKDGEATTLNNIGAVYDDLGKNQKALEFYNQALLLLGLVKDPNSAGVTLNNLMQTWSILSKSRLATFYGKQSVNAYQQIRANIQELDKGVQKSFLVFNQNTYRYLAELLISQNRLQEAAQILDLLKLQEFSDFINRSGSSDRPTAEADFSPSEDEKRKQYDHLSDHLFRLNSEFDDLSRKEARTPGEEVRVKALEQEINQVKQAFQQFIAQLPDYFSQPEAGPALEINGIKPIVRDLGAGAVALYTLLAQNNYYVILISPQMDHARHYAIKRVVLEKKVNQFKEVLQNPKLDPRPAAHELYQILLAPIAAELKQAKAQTLMWSLDGALRYLPMSALYDGKQYLVEKYQNVVIDPTSQSRLREQPASSKWHGVGMGTSKAYAGLKPLSNVSEELDEIFRQEDGKDNRGVVPGETMLNDTFTETSMFQALKRNYKVVHIASHFVLSSKDARESYLLLGNGEQLKLSQISEGAKIFDQVDLVVLSACDTASGGEDADGREVDAFGIITQQKGAKAVLASLWPVVDESTKEVMVDFYQRLRGRTQVSKAEALRQAQLRLLRGEVQGVSTVDQVARRGDEPKTAVSVKELRWEEEASPWPEYKVDPKALYGHPYYWAPFILIGNWR